VIDISAADKTETVVESSQSSELMGDHQPSLTINKSGFSGFVDDRRFALEKM
jgi:hypothetical protein